jgi:hypothetical protein
MGQGGVKAHGRMSTWSLSIRRVRNKLDEYRIIRKMVTDFNFNPISVNIVQFDPCPSPVGAQNGFLYILFADDGIPQ